jgi:ABC-2 type transport system ATP-binding protein
MELFGISPALLEKIQGLAFVDSAVAEDQGPRQLLRVQTALGAKAIPDLMACMNGTEVGRVTVREATLEDAYVRLVGRVE